MLLGQTDYGDAQEILEDFQDKNSGELPFTGDEYHNFVDKLETILFQHFEIDPRDGFVDTPAAKARPELKFEDVLKDCNDLIDKAEKD